LPAHVPNGRHQNGIVIAVAEELGNTAAVSRESRAELSFHGALHQLVAINAANALAFLVLPGAILYLPDNC
jgi:hypothetical protein